jgi:predicted transcriptional regulator
MNNNISDSSKSNLHNHLDQFSVTYYDWMTNPQGLNLSPLQSSLHVYAVIYGVSRLETGFMGASTYALAERIGFTRRSVVRAIKDLLEKDLIVCEAIRGNERTGQRLYRVNDVKINEAIDRLNSSNFYAKTSKGTIRSFQQSADKPASDTKSLGSISSDTKSLGSDTVTLASDTKSLASEQAKYKNVENFSGQSTCENTEKQQVDNVMQFDQTVYINKKKEKKNINSSFSFEKLDSVEVKEKDTLVRLIKNWIYPPLDNRFEELVTSWNKLIEDGFTSEQIWKCYEVKRDLYLSENHEMKSDFGTLWYWLHNDGKARAELFKLGMRPHKKPVNKPYEVYKTREHCAEGNMVFCVQNGELKYPRLIELPLDSSDQTVYEAALAATRLSNL